MRKFLAFLLALALAIPMLVLSFFLISIQSWAFDRDFYKKALSGDEAFAAMEAAVSADAFKDIETIGVKVDNRALGKALFTALPREELRKNIVAMIDGSFDVLEGKQGSRAVSLGGERLASVLERNAKAFALSYAESVPEGTAPAVSLTDVSVRPKGMSAPAFAARIQPIVDKGVASAAASLREKSTFDLPDPRKSGLPFGADFIKTARFFIGFLLAATAFVLLVGFLLWPKPWAGRFAYLGVIVVLGSISSIMIGVAGGIFINMENIRSAFGSIGLALPAEAMTPLLRGYLAELVGTVTRSFFITGIIGASAGAGILSLRWVAAAREI